MIYSIPQLIEQAAFQYPEKEAFSYMGSSLSYKELYQKSNALAAVLLSQGITKGDRVGIYMKRSLETAIAIYGIVRFGGVYVPLDATAPIERVKQLISDCGITYIITNATQKREVAGLVRNETLLKGVIGLKEAIGIRTISWDTVFNFIYDGLTFPRVLGKDLAYIMYTSGSTGLPKGIMHTHNSCLAYARLSMQAYGLCNTDVVAGHAPIHFDISTFAYFTAPLAAAKVVILSEAHTKMPVSLSQLMEKEGISFWYSAPQALIQLITHGLLEKRNMRSLRWVLFGGEVFQIKYLKKLIELWPWANFSNVYGPAEVNQCTFFNLGSEYVFGEVLPLGTIWDNTDYRILDNNDQPVNKGEPGNLAVRSETMMLGYWNNKALTDKSLYKEFPAPDVDHLFFRTGDVVRENGENELVFVGRSDRQVKVRGYRVELEEVEARITSHKDIQEAAVFLDGENADGGKNVLMAAVRPFNPNNELAEKDIKMYCSQTLPKYAVPEMVYSLVEFPRTTSGKIDRNKLKTALEALKNG